jgi:hypothetical protein
LAKLSDLLRSVLAAAPAAVAIDIDFCTDLKSGLLFDPKELVLAPALLSTRKQVPVCVAVHRGLTLPPDVWLGDPKYLLVAAHAETPKSNGTEPRKMLAALQEQNLILPSLAGVLARSLHHERLRPPRWLVSQFGSKMELDVRGELMALGGEYRLNSSCLDRLRNEKIDLTNGRMPVQDDLNSLAGKAVLIGSSTEDPLAWKVPGQPGRVEKGLFLHALGAETLSESPIFEVRPWVQVVADIVVGLLISAIVLRLRKRSVAEFSAFDEGRALILALFLGAVGCGVLSLILIKVFGVLWTNLLLFPFLLLLHPAVRSFVVDLFRWTVGIGKLVWRRFFFLPNGARS